MSILRARHTHRGTAKMYSILFISATTSLLYGYAIGATPPSSTSPTSTRQARLIGGGEVDGHFAYQASVQLSSECVLQGYVCGATLVSSRHVLTAASCVTDKPGGFTWTATRATQLRVLVAPDLEDEDAAASVRRVTVHPLYQPDTHLHDLAVLELWEDVSELGSSLELAAGTAAAEGGRGEEWRCNVTGWGVSSSTGTSYSSRLHYAEVTAALPGEDAAACSAAVAAAAFPVSCDMLCAGDSLADLCAGDRGAPLVCGGELRGVATHGGCGGGSLFTDLTSADHRAFVLDVIGSGPSSGAVVAATLPLVLTALVSLYHSL